MLEARTFTIFTDHKPLTFALQQKAEKASPRQARHLDFIGQFSTDIRHISGKDNIVADTLSRLKEAEATLDSTALAKAQQMDEELKTYLCSGSLQLKQIEVPGTSGTVFCDISTATARPYITPAFR